ncbi:hypothetical protein, partial [Bradyrhizobium ottawaense]|uniref:hypothetical protein n=7 Tax=Bradyrhizobium TaxID=374 RepID=UPI0030C74913
IKLTMPPDEPEPPFSKSLISLKLSDDGQSLPLSQPGCCHPKDGKSGRGSTLLPELVSFSKANLPSIQARSLDADAAHAELGGPLVDLQEILLSERRALWIPIG